MPALTSLLISAQVQLGQKGFKRCYEAPGRLCPAWNRFSLNPIQLLALAAITAAGDSFLVCGWAAVARCICVMLRGEALPAWVVNSLARSANSQSRCTQEGWAGGQI